MLGYYGSLNMYQEKVVQIYQSGTCGKKFISIKGVRFIKKALRSFTSCGAWERRTCCRSGSYYLLSDKVKKFLPVSVLDLG